MSDFVSMVNEQLAGVTIKRQEHTFMNTLLDEAIYVLNVTGTRYIMAINCSYVDGSIEKSQEMIDKWKSELIKAGEVS